MNGLLAAVKQALSDAELGPVEVMPDLRAWPEAVLPPLIVLCDGGYTRQRDGLNETTGFLTVQVVPYYPALQREESVLGGGQRDGLEALCAAIHTALDDNLLGLANYEDAWPGPDAPVEVFGDEQSVLVRKVLTFQYQRVET